MLVLIHYFIAEQNSKSSQQVVKEPDQSPPQPPLPSQEEATLEKSLKSPSPIKDESSSKLSTEIATLELLDFPDVVSVVTVGVTGHGKSQFLNFLCKSDEKFAIPSGYSVGSCTKSVSKALFSVKDKTCHLIDTPGLLDTHTHELFREGNSIQDISSIIGNDTESHLKDALLLAGETLNVFLFVYNPICKWTMEMEVAMNILEKRILWDHTILILTHGLDAFSKKTEEDAFGKKTKKDAFESKTEEDMLKELEQYQGSSECPRGYKRLLDKIQNRIVIVESKHWRQDKSHYNEVMHQLLTCIDNISSKSQGIKNVQFLEARKKEADKFLEEYKKSKFQETFSTVAVEYKSAYDEVQAKARELVPVMDQLIGCLKDVGISLLAWEEKISRAKVPDRLISLVGIIVTAIGVTIFNPFVVGFGLDATCSGTIRMIAIIVERLKDDKALQESDTHLKSYMNNVDAFYDALARFNQSLPNGGESQKIATTKAVCHFLQVKEDESTNILRISEATTKLDILKNLKSGHLHKYKGNTMVALAVYLREFFRGKDAAEGAAHTYLLSEQHSKSPDYGIKQVATLLGRERDVIKTLAGLPE